MQPNRSHPARHSTRQPPAGQPVRARAMPGVPVAASATTAAVARKGKGALAPQQGVPFFIANFEQGRAITPFFTHALKPAQTAFCALLLGLAGHALAQSGPPAPDDSAASASAAALAWQQCTALPDAQRLACFDDWARTQRSLLQALDDKARAVAQSPNPQPVPGAPALRQDVARALASALASAQPAAPQGGPAAGEAGQATTPTASAGIIGVGLEQGCRDRQFSELSRFWELEAGSSCPTFGLRAFHPSTVSVATGNRINRQPQSPNPANSATAPTAYRKHELAVNLSLRTKLASGLLTPAQGGLRDSLWMAYTQNARWQLFNGDLSRPFRSTDHMPELMYVYPTTAYLPGGWVWRYSGVGVAHQSNGQSDPLSRSWNRIYLMTGIEKGRDWHINLRLWKRLPERSDKDNNPDIVKYLGRGDINAHWRLDSRNALQLTYTGFNRRGSGKLAWTYALGQGQGNSFSGLRLYTWVFHGYGETLLDYNFKRTSFGVGLSLVDF